MNFSDANQSPAPSVVMNFLYANQSTPTIG
jgi:hypothetical protein